MGSVTSAAGLLAIVTVALPATGGLAQLGPLSPRVADGLNRVVAVATAGAALALAAVTLAHPGAPHHDNAFLVDAASGVFVGVIAIVGLLSALVSPAYLASGGQGFFRPGRAHAWYYLGLYLFWALLLAIPIVGNLGVAWLLVEATTAASALLVAHSGKASALEAGWKYLVLTTVGLTVALLGIVMLFVASSHGGDFASLDWDRIPGLVNGIPHGTAVVAFVLILVGLAAKIGWAPVHNWLPDAHSEAPPPVSAMLSAALLPTVMLVAWRVRGALEPAIGGSAARTVFIAFGLASLAVAVPFLWQPLAWKRLLAYSSLEHMGVLALGIGFAHPIAIAGVLLHVAGHAFAKALGFYAATPLLRHQPSSGRRLPTGLMRTSPPTAGAVGISLAALSGLPPSPLFFSELFVLLGGVYAHQLWAVAIAGVLLALGFLGLGHALIEGLAGRARAGGAAIEARPVLAVTAVLGAGLAALSAIALFLPDSGIVDAVARWAS